MRIAIAGKGGSGKTTIAGTMARILARAGRSVLAVDADTNPNLATILGMTPDTFAEITDLPRDLMERRQQPDGTMKSVFAADPYDVVRDYGAIGPDGVRMLVMGRIAHGGAGWMCRAHATVRGLIGALVSKGSNGGDIIVDMEAGLEHLARGTGRHVNKLLTVIEPYFRSMETARRAAELASELEIADVAVVANKIRNDEDRQAMHDFCMKHHLAIAAEIPHDDQLIAAERAEATPLDCGESIAVDAIGRLTERLIREGAES